MRRRPVAYAAVLREPEPVKERTFSGGFGFRWARARGASPGRVARDTHEWKHDENAWTISTGFAVRP